VTELAARIHRRVMKWCATPDEPGQLSPAAPLDAGLVLFTSVAVLALLAPLAV